jgi:hypothetical protein
LERSKTQLARKDDDPTTICEPVVWKMCAHRHLTTLLAVTACYKDSFAKQEHTRSDMMSRWNVFVPVSNTPNFCMISLTVTDRCMYFHVHFVLKNVKEVKLTS